MEVASIFLSRPSLQAATVGAQPASGGGSSLKDMWAVTFRDAPEQVFLLQRPEYKVTGSSGGYRGRPLGDAYQLPLRLTMGAKVIVGVAIVFHNLLGFRYLQQN